MRYLLPLLLVLSPPARAQAPSGLPQAGELSVRAEVVGRGEPSQSRGHCPTTFFVRLELRNETAKPVAFNQMKCSWTDFWLVEGPYELRVSSCDSNYPTTLTLAPGQAMRFYGTLCGHPAPDRPQRLRVAFVALALSEVAHRYSAPQLAAYATAHQRPVFWSHPFTDDFWNDSYQLAEPGR